MLPQEVRLPEKSAPTQVQKELTVLPSQIAQLLAGLGIREAQTALFKAFMKPNSNASGFGEIEQISTYTGAKVVNWIKLYEPDSDKSASPLVTLPIVVIKVGLDREIVRTQLVGRQGTVKEIITTGDWAIEIEGIIFNYDDKDKYKEFPKTKIKELAQVLEKSQVLSVVSPYLNDVFEIYNIVISSSFIEQIDNSNNSVRFRIQAFSDKKLELLL